MTNDGVFNLRQAAAHGFLAGQKRQRGGIMAEQDHALAGLQRVKGGANFSQVVFSFRVSPPLLWTGLKWALAIGFIGGLFPALRAARMPVTAGLREL